MTPDTGIIRPFDRRARIVTALGAERDMVTQTCFVHLIRSTWGKNIPLALLPRSGNPAFFGGKMLRLGSGISVLSCLIKGQRSMEPTMITTV